VTAAGPRVEVLAGWGMAHHARSRVYRPADEEGVAHAVNDAVARGLSLTARGAGLSYGDAALNQGGAVVLTEGLAGVVSFDPASGRVTARAGTTLRELWTRTISQGWWPPVVPGTMEVTLGGCVAMNVHGKNHAQSGAFGAHVEGVTLLDGDGATRRVTREESPAELAAVVGGMGLGGVILDVTLRLKRVHSGFLAVEGWATRSLEDTLEALRAGVADSDYTVAWLDCTGGRAGRGVVHTARHLDEGHPLVGEGLDAEAQGLPSRIAGVLPREWAVAPLKALNRPAGIRLLNAAKHGAARVRGRSRYVQTHAAFHFLLDHVPGWKRIYAPAGLIQYQMFVPAESALSAFSAALERQRALGVPGHLAVVKRHRAEESAAGYCMDGYSLAMDFPVGRGEGYTRLVRLCAELDAVQAASGGTVYAAKDAVSAGLGRLPRKHDPRFSSNLVRRWQAASPHPQP